MGAYDCGPMSLLDSKGRRITYLRLSVTDRCNYRCTYCMPPEGFERAPRDAVLSLEELARVVRIFARLGVETVRLTGGEPMVRRGLVDLVARIAATEGIRDVAMTTNAELLDHLAAPLRRAGLTRLNVSLDTLDPKRFSELTRGGRLDHVLAGLDAAREAGFERIKLNAVVVRGVNDQELEDLVDFAWSRGMVPRFIELMPLGEAGRMHGRQAVVPIREMRDRLAHRLGDLPRDGVGPGAGPAVYYPDQDRSDRAVGFIGAVTESFCAGCNRVRVTSEGQLRGCLARPEGSDLRALMREGADDEAIAEAVRRTVLGRKEGHEFWEDSPGDSSGLVVMTGIGG